MQSKKLALSSSAKPSNPPHKMEVHPSLHLKNMVCRRCVMAVEQIFSQLHLPFEGVELGEVRLTRPLTDEEMQQLSVALEAVGFELLSDKRAQLVEAIRLAVMDFLNLPPAEQHDKLSAFLVNRLHQNYSTLSGLFSEAQGITIERFAILQRVEKVKELLVYDELSLKEIAFRLNYSSPAHLSAQFKQVTGMPPGEFKRMGGRPIPRDRVAN